MARLINTTTMIVDGRTDVDEWFVAEGDRDRAARGQFDDAAGMYEELCTRRVAERGGAEVGAIRREQDGRAV
jgi:hypothetical protein